MRLVILSAALLALSPGLVEPTAEEFRMTVADVFSIAGRGVVITGVVEGGPVAVDDVVCLRPAEGDRKEITVKGADGELRPTSSDASLPSGPGGARRSRC